MTRIEAIFETWAQPPTKLDKAVNIKPMPLPPMNHPNPPTKQTELLPTPSTASEKERQELRVLMPADERCEWIMRWIKSQPCGVDVLNSDFVDDYVAATKAKFTPVCWGAVKCPMLGRDLSRMAKCGALKRGRIGLGMNWQPGFPRWAWSYRIGHAAYLFDGALNPTSDHE